MAGHNRPNQGGRSNLSRIPKALQKPGSSARNSRKRRTARSKRDHSSGENDNPRAGRSNEDAAVCNCEEALSWKDMMVTVNHEIDFEKAQEIAHGITTSLQNRKKK